VAPLYDAVRRERLEALVASTYVPLRSYLRRRTDPAAADDVLGDVLLVMWRRLDDVPTDLPLAWCYAVARGCLANAARREGRQRRLLHRLSQQPQPGHAAGSDDPDLEEALAALPPGDREVLRLWAWEQLAPREIAVVLGVTPNAASIRLHRATRRLREKLGTGKERGGDGQIDPRHGTEAPR
jgi:RNA polymerase sigma-70 factor (ECF subfamily)